MIRKPDKDTGDGENRSEGDGKGGSAALRSRDRIRIVRDHDRFGVTHHLQNAIRHELGGIPDLIDRKLEEVQQIRSPAEAGEAGEIKDVKLSACDGVKAAAQLNENPGGSGIQIDGCASQLRHVDGAQRKLDHRIRANCQRSVDGQSFHWSRIRGGISRTKDGRRTSGACQRDRTTDATDAAEKRSSIHRDSTSASA